MTTTNPPVIDRHMRTVAYRLCHTQTAGAAGVAEQTVASKGRVVGYRASQMVTAAAGGVISVVSEVCVNQNAISTSTTNGATKETIIGGFRCSALTSTVGSTETGFVPCNIPCLAGAKLSINTTNVGTTPTTQGTNCDVYFIED